VTLEIEVAAAGERDYPAVASLLARAHREWADALPPGSTADYLDDLSHVLARARGGALLVARWGGRVVGTVTYYADGRSDGTPWPPGFATLDALGVDPAARRLGVGRRLIAACVQRAAAQGQRALGLRAGQRPPAVIEFCEALGFRRAPALDVSAAAVPGLPPRAALLGQAYQLDLDLPPP
jgi:GNAT superfamily N-acetyltransferase